MTDNNVFRSKEEELRKLTQEIAEIKSSIKAISSAVDRIERHVKRAFGVPSKPQGKKAASSQKGERKQSKEQPSITPEQALTIFDELSTLWDREKPQEIEGRLRDMTVPDLKLIAHELGITFPTKPSKKSLCAGIIGRLNERAMLSRNVNVTLSQRERMQSDEKSE